MVIGTAQVIAAFLSLVSGIIYLHIRQERKLDKCEESHEEATKNLIDLNGRVGRLEGERDGIQAGVEASVKAVIEEVRRLERDRK